MGKDSIQRGAYLLRLWDTELVATSSPASPPSAGYIGVRTETKNEVTTRERQIWWIERVTGDEENDEYPIRQKYTITHCGSGRGLVRNGQTPSVYGMHGKPSEHWNFVPELPQFPQFRYRCLSPILQKDLTLTLILAPTLSTGTLNHPV